MVKRLKVGDIFIVPTGDERAGVGQVVASYGKDAYYFAVFDRVVPSADAPDQAADAVHAPGATPGVVHGRQASRRALDCRGA